MPASSGYFLSSSLVFGNVLLLSYGWRPEHVGLLTIPSAVASIGGIVTTGFGGDFVTKGIARRNCGVHEVRTREWNRLHECC